MSTSGAWATKGFGEEDLRIPPWLQTAKERFDEMVNLLRWSPFTQEPEGQSPAIMSERNNKESPLTTKDEAGLEPNSAWFRMLRPFAPTPEEPPKSALSFFSPGAITSKDCGALFDFGNMSSGFGQAEGELPKSLSGLGNRYNQETRIEMDGLKEEIKNIKINEDKIMQLLQDLREEMKDSVRSSMAIEEDQPVDEIRAMVRTALEPG